MDTLDIRDSKNAMRKQIKEYRASLSKDKKLFLDNKIAENFLNTDAYKKCKSLLCYVSTQIEVDTTKIITQALKDKKLVAVPRCIAGTKLMDFIRIMSFDDLEEGAYGVREPKLSINRPVICDKKSLCVIPALLYDKYGYRLGYGGGYYDRFLENFEGQTVGIIYSENIVDELSRGKFDLPIALIVSERAIIKSEKAINIFNIQEDNGERI